MRVVDDLLVARQGKVIIKPTHHPHARPSLDSTSKNQRKTKKQKSSSCMRCIYATPGRGDPDRNKVEQDDEKKTAAQFLICSV